jgi:hypothetical protein
MVRRRTPSENSVGSHPKVWIGWSIARPSAHVACTWPATPESLRVLARAGDFSHGRCGHDESCSGTIINTHHVSKACVQSPRANHVSPRAAQIVDLCTSRKPASRANAFALSVIAASFWRAPAGRKDIAASRRGLCDLRTRSEESIYTCCGAYVASVQQHMFRAHVALLTRSRSANADYATSERVAKRARRADADYMISAELFDLRKRCEESAASRSGLCDLRARCEESARRADADQKNPQPKADYATYKRDAKRAQRADADQTSSLTQSL